MATLANLIEQYIADLISRSGDGTVDIQRAEVADKFRCVPSQVTYVLDTRFTPERGYIVESKRGGGGYIRIVRITYSEHTADVLQVLNEQIGEYIDQRRAENLIAGLLEHKRISEREAALLLGAVRREAIAVELPLRDAIRARVLRSMLTSLLSCDPPDRSR